MMTILNGIFLNWKGTFHYFVVWVDQLPKTQLPRFFYVINSGEIPGYTTIKENTVQFNLTEIAHNKLLISTLPFNNEAEYLAHYIKKNEGGHSWRFFRIQNTFNKLLISTLPFNNEGEYLAHYFLKHEGGHSLRFFIILVFTQ